MNGTSNSILENMLLLSFFDLPKAFQGTVPHYLLLETYTTHWSQWPPRSLPGLKITYPASSNIRSWMVTPQLLSQSLRESLRGLFLGHF